MFCKNCGSELALGAKFCSECGTKVEEVIVRNFDTLAFEETTNAANEAASAQEAFKERVSFDWSNVIDEPQKKEVPQEIKSPWAATTDAIDEREIYEEMTQSDDKNRTMSFIDVLRADREERERAAVDKSIEYTEVLEIDPELLGGTKPPKMHVPPLYDDVDEPVKTPFDELRQTTSFDTGSFDAPVLDASELEPAEELTQTEPGAENGGAGRFELPDFLKKAVGFGVAKETIERIEKEPEATIEETEPVAETTESVVEEPVIEETIFEAPAAESAPAEAPIIEEAAAEETAGYDSETSSELYLDEDIYLDLEATSPGTARMSRVDAHTLAGDYDLFEESDDDDDDDDHDDYDDDHHDDDHEEYEIKIDEDELFTEMSETPGSRGTGMTIAAPADEEAEIEALKRRLAELTGTVEIDPAELEATEAAKPAVEISEPEVEEAAAAAVEPGFEDFMFEPELTPEDDALFEGLTPARESAPEQEVKMPEPEFDDFMFEPELTPEDDALFESLTPAKEIAHEAPEATPAPKPEAEPKTEEPETLTLESFAAAAPAADTATYAVGHIDFEPPAPTISDDQKSAFESLNFDIPSEPAVQEPAPAPAAEEPVFAATVFEEPAEEEPKFEPFEAPVDDDSPIVGFAPAVTEPEAHTEQLVSQPVVEDAPATTPRVEQAAPAELKTSDALSLDELERDLFGDNPEDVADIETKKIDKFYTLYRKNEEFQRLLDEEYSKLKGEHIAVPEDDDYTVDEKAAPNAAEAAPAADEIAKEESKDTAPSSEAPAFSLDDFVTEENARPVEDATIYREMPEDFKEAVAQAEAPEAPTFGLDGTEALEASVAAVETDSTAAQAAVAAGAAAVAGAAVATADKESAKADAKAAKEEARAAKKAAREAKKAEKAAAKASAAADSQAEYENVDGGSTILTILAVLVAILLVALLVIILILHIAPDSGIALTIDEFIQNLTERFSSLEVYSGMRVI